MANSSPVDFLIAFLTTPKEPLKKVYFKIKKEKTTIPIPYQNGKNGECRPGCQNFPNQKPCT